MFAKDPVGVTLGGTLGHALCTALAVIGGKIIAQRISVRTGNLYYIACYLHVTNGFLHLNILKLTAYAKYKQSVNRKVCYVIMINYIRVTVPFFVVTLIGGVVFLLFAVTAFIHDTDSEQTV